RAARRMLADGHTFTAVSCANDPTASGVLRALAEEGLDVPGDISVVGCDDEFGGFTSPPLTTVRIDKRTMGAEAVRRLLYRCENLAAPAATIMTPVELVVRSSVGPPAD